MATSDGIHDVAASLFVDALGRGLPLREHFSFKDLCDFLRKEGVFGLDDLDSQDLVKIASVVGNMTEGNVKISAEPVVTTTTRTPLSSVDLRISGETVVGPPPTTRPIQPLDRLVLEDGVELHVVRTGSRKCVGMDDTMQTREFTTDEVVAIVSMDDPILE